MASSLTCTTVNCVNRKIAPDDETPVSDFTVMHGLRISRFVHHVLTMRSFSIRPAFLCLATLLISLPASGQNFSWSDTYGKSPTEFTPGDWAPIIDAHWGEGLPDQDKRNFFDRWWNELDQRFGAHHNIDIDLEALRDRYRPEVNAGGVSRGRFAGIMGHMTYQLEELHTYLFDIPVRNTPMTKGVPMMVIGQWGNNPRFGALLTPLPDSTLLVYETIPNHPLGLVRGDVVLGYDGVLWKDIYPSLLEAELPIFYNSVNASTPEGNYYYAMQAAGLNYHLFDELDVVQYATGDTLHFDTNLLSGVSTTLWGKEQIAPPGVPWPNRSTGNRVGWGIIDNTNIGIVTVTSWSFDAQFDIRAKFEQAVDAMMNIFQADGIIFDFRFNTGGGALAREGLQLLFNETVPTVGFDRRVSGSADKLEMEPDPSRREANLVIQGDPSTYYDKPIAILIGPGSISAGELEARRMSFHPRSRVFGLPAPGGNTGSDFLQLGQPDWIISRANSTQYLVDGHVYLSHVGMQPDVRIWFDKDDVANGIDTVIKTAIDWIESGGRTGNENTSDIKVEPSVTTYPNPFRQNVTFELRSSTQSVVDIEVFDILGRRVDVIASGANPAHRARFDWDGTNDSGIAIPVGLYFWRVSSNTAVASGSFLKVK